MIQEMLFALEINFDQWSRYYLLHFSFLFLEWVFHKEFRPPQKTQLQRLTLASNLCQWRKCRSFPEESQNSMHTYNGDLNAQGQIGRTKKYLLNLLLTQLAILERAPWNFCMVKWDKCARIELLQYWRIAQSGHQDTQRIRRRTCQSEWCCQWTWSRVSKSSQYLAFLRTSNFIETQKPFPQTSIMKWIPRTNQFI
jgi:hypothetical protein